MSSVWIQAPRPGSVARARIASRADVAEIERVPFRELLPAWSILGVLEASAAAAPGKAAIIVADREDPTRVARHIGYAEFAGMVRAAANRLRALSGTAPPVVSILTPLVPEAFIALWAGETAGVANPINPFLRIEHVAGIMNAARTTVLVCGREAAGTSTSSQVAELSSRVPTLRAVWFIDESGGADSFQRQIDAAPADRLQFEPSGDEMRTLALLHTGGTTAAPKLVRHTPRGQLLNAWCSGTWAGSRPDAVIANGMPYFHVGGAVCIALRSMVYGQTLLIVGPDGYRNPRVIARFWDLVAAHGVTGATSTPTTAAALVAAYDGRGPPADFAYSAGGSAVPVQVAREFEEKFGIPLREGWGMTEVQGALISNPAAARPRPGSIGIPFPYHGARCVRVDSRSADEPLPPDTVGVLAVSGPCITPGYLDAAQTRELFLESRSGQVWLTSGDLGRIDADGYVWLQGRAKDLIIRGGHNIDPVTIEAALTSHPAVLHAAAIGEPDADKGELPVAYVQLRPKVAASEAELLDHCQREICERAALPRAVRIIDLMPLTAVGKIFKPALRLDATERCVRGLIGRCAAGDAVSAEVRDLGAGLCVVLRSRDAGRADLLDRVRCDLERYALRVEVDSGRAR